MTPDQRDIVLIPVPFSDLSSAKRRPVLVLSNDRHNRRSEDVVVAAITSQLARRDYGVLIFSDDLQSGRLAHDSLIRADKLYTLHKDAIIKRFGRLKAEPFRKVLQQIASLFA
ncbi:MAG: type II toxin-antitoxin system PemK/MazF family toxin [Tepidisphaeraceae bacterium]